MFYVNEPRASQAVATAAKREKCMKKATDARLEGTAEATDHQRSGQVQARMRSLWGLKSWLGGVDA